jgi:hypothetical protein
MSTTANEMDKLKYVAVGKLACCEAVMVAHNYAIMFHDDHTRVEMQRIQKVRERCSDRMIPFGSVDGEGDESLSQSRSHKRKDS